jgi:hypothetical protein
LASRGFILPLVVSLIFIVAILAFSYNMRSREEAWRVHRLYFSDLLTKSAEGLGEAAFAWFQANPNNDLARKIRGDPSGTTFVSLLGKLPVELRMNEIGVVVKDCRISIVCDYPFLESEKGPNGFPPGFSTSDGGFLFPDFRERYGLLKVEVEVYTLHKNFSRKYEVLREFRAIHLLPSIFSQFTLFVKNKKPLFSGDPNHLKMKLGPIGQSEFSGYTDETKPLGNPMILIHHVQERNRLVPKDSRSPNNTVSIPWTEPLDLKNRGWVFLGSLDNSLPVNSVDNFPFRMWLLNVFQGHVFQANTKTLPGQRFFGQLFMLPTFRWLLFHTSMADFSHRGIPPDPNLFSNPPFTGDALGIPFRGTFFFCSREGYFSGHGSRAAEYSIPSKHFQNYFDETRNFFHKNESIDGPLIHLFGDLFPSPGRERTQLVDERSPTLVLGNAMFRFKQITRVSQMGEERYKWVSTNDMANFFNRNEQLPPSQKPSNEAIPYFPFRGATLDPRLPLPLAEFQSDPTWQTVTERNPAGREYAAVSYPFLDIIGSQENYKSLMSKFITALPAQIFENILQNNMEDDLAPSGWLPKPKHLLSIPDTIVPLDENGAEAPVTARQFFFTQHGQAYKGSGMLIRDNAGVNLAGGNFSNLWPFADSTTVRDGQFICSTFDLRQKTTHLVASPQDFADRFIKTEQGKRILDLKGSVVTVLGGDLHVTGKLSALLSRNELLYRDGGMVIVHDGELHIESSILRENSSAVGIPLTLATAKSGKHLWLTPGTRLEAYLISSGTLKRRNGTKTGFDITGGVAVQFLDFSENPESIFYGHPDSLGERFRVTWHPDFNIFSSPNRNRTHRILLGPQKSYWKSEPL